MLATPVTFVATLVAPAAVLCVVLATARRRRRSRGRSLAQRVTAVASTTAPAESTAEVTIAGVPADSVAADEGRASCDRQSLAYHVDWAELSSGQDRRTTLQLLRFPNSMCQPGAIQRALSQVSLLQTIDFVHCVKGSGRQLGTAIVNVVLLADVPAVVRFFHGRQYGRAPPVQVRFSKVQGLQALRAAYVKTPLSCCHPNMLASHPPSSFRDSADSQHGNDET